MTTAWRDFYGDYYASEPSEWRQLGAVAKVDNLLALLERRRVSSSPSVLEIGCGEGAVLAELRQRGVEGRGVELSESGAEVAAGRGFDVRLLDGVDTGFGDKEFDVALLTHVVEHLENPRATLREASRVATWVAVEVPLEYRWRTPRDYRPSPIGHINLYDMKLIRQLLQSTDLEVVEELVTNPSVRTFTVQSGAMAGRLQWVLREAGLRLVPPLAQRLFTYHGTLLCRS